MDKLKSLSPLQAAQVLFWLNLLPAAGFLTLITLSFGDDITIDAKAFFVDLLMLAGVIAEVIYFLQFNFKRYAVSKSTWMYSMIYNGLFALSILIIAIISQIWGLMWFIVYPNFFFYLSWMSYGKVEE